MLKEKWLAVVMPPAVEDLELPAPMWLREPRSVRPTGAACLDPEMIVGFLPVRRR